MFSGLHWYDLIVLLVVALLFFGPKRLPEMGSAVGKTIKEFQKSMREVTQPTQEAPVTSLPEPAPAATVRVVEPPAAAQPASAQPASPDNATASTGTIPAETRQD